MLGVDVQKNGLLFPVELIVKAEKLIKKHENQEACRLCLEGARGV